MVPMTRSAPALLLALIVVACAPARAPLTDVPAGNYALVEPAPDGYHVASIIDRAWAVRIGDRTLRGQHWVDSQGRLHMTDDEGPCAGVESIWTYQYTNNRVTLDLVEDRCTVRPNPFPQRLVYERR